MRTDFIEASGCHWWKFCFWELWSFSALCCVSHCVAGCLELIKKQENLQQIFCCIPQEGKQQSWKHHKSDDDVSRPFINPLFCLILSGVWGQSRAAHFSKVKRLQNVPSCFLACQGLPLLVRRGRSCLWASSWPESGGLDETEPLLCLKCLLLPAKALCKVEVSHGLSLGIPDSRFENTPKPATFSQMDGQNWLWFLWWCLYVQAQLWVLSCSVAGAWEAAAAMASDPWGGTTGMSEL